MEATTNWSKMEVAHETSRYLRGTHYLWSRLFDGVHIFTVRPIQETPKDSDGGYVSIDAALSVKGMRNL